MRTLGRWKNAGVIIPLAVVAGVLGACSGNDSSGEDQSRSTSVATAITPIKRVNCSAKSYTQKFMGRIWWSVNRELGKNLYLMSSDVNCGQWSGRSNPTKLAKLGPASDGGRPPGVSYPFRLEVGSASRPQWRMRMVTRNPDGTFKELYSFKLTFAPFPKRSAYRGLFLCFTKDCNNVNQIKECPFPPTSTENIDCGFLPDANTPKQVSRGVWSQGGISYITPAFGGFKPFVITTYSTDDRSSGTFEIEINERVPGNFPYLEW